MILKRDKLLNPIYIVKSLLISVIVTGLFTYAAATPAEPPFILPPRAELNRLKTAVIYTSRGRIDIELFPEDAPWHVANLKYLADKGYYKGLKFHLYYPDYIIQGGDPTGTGKGGPPYSLPPEFNTRIHKAGTMGMARTGGMSNPERRSNGSQFHILLREAPKMDGEYTVFGQVKNGMSVLKKLRKDDVIRDLVVYVREEG